MTTVKPGRKSRVATWSCKRRIQPRTTSLSTKIFVLLDGGMFGVGEVDVRGSGWR